MKMNNSTDQQKWYVVLVSSFNQEVTRISEEYDNKEDAESAAHSPFTRLACDVELRVMSKDDLPSEIMEDWERSVAVREA